ncbi:hypothetical protein [Granulicella mallensis]|uniref:Uncharacterized protein n=1 Tax=Granulicella mallensis TaxID=940614 RepID=A0A7W8E9F3_9BACT|nr:hypothetical protein [Granulicella mallensis]MBB5064398.1 hypothetical protein [Granulicella mallensis]
MSTPAATPIAFELQEATASPKFLDAPVPAEIRAAKNIFVESSAQSSDMYKRFITALTAWGRYTILESPDKADVIFEFNDSPLEVKILEPSSRITLWTVSDPSNGLYPEGNRNKRASHLIMNLVSEIKELSGAPLSDEENAALKSPSFRKSGGLLFIIITVGALALAAGVVLALHGRGRKA